MEGTDPQEEQRVPQGMPSPRLVLLLAAATLIVFGGVGAWLIISVQDRSLTSVLFGATPIWKQVLIGIASGLVIGAGAWASITRSFLAPVRVKYATLIGPLMPLMAAQVLVSICAGVGEELFFRGALQHWLGIPWTAVVFVALHGYLDPRDVRISLYGIYLTGAMIVLGWLAQEMGLLAPIIAHTLIDIVLLNRLVNDWRKTVS